MARWRILSRNKKTKKLEKAAKNDFKNKKKAFKVRNWIRSHGKRSAKIVDVTKSLKTTKKNDRTKWSPTRDAIQSEAKKRGLRHTSGNRSYNSLASVGRMSDHWVRVLSSWADDYWHQDPKVMVDFAKWAQGQDGIKQVLVHDAGSGDHVHVAGYSR